MKILLAAVNAKYIHASLALHSLRMYAKDYTDQIEICEFTINMQGEDILEQLYRKKPDLLAFSCYIWNIDLIRDVAADLHKVRPDLPIWLGGPEVSFDSEKILAENPAVTGIMRGEGEEIFRRLAAFYAGEGGSLEEIPMITWRDADGIIHSGREWTREEVVPMDELPFVYEDLTPFRNKIIYYETSRGCPFSCSYCLSALEHGARLRSLDKVLPELQHFLDQKVPQVKFVDRTFNMNHRHAMAIWNYINDHDNGVTNFHFEIEANVLTDDELELFGKMRPGLIQMEIGVQSVNTDTLTAVNRNPDFTKITDAAHRIIQGGNIHLHLDLIAGLPYEDYESFRRSFNLVYGLRPDELQLGFLKLLRGSIIEQQAQQYGIVARDKAPYEVLKTDWLSYADLCRLKEVEEMLEVYGNSQQFPTTIRELEKEFPDAMAMYEAMADYYRAHGFEGLSLSRMQRFDILREMIAEMRPDRIGFYEDSLLKDLYLRENAKSRPSWARDLAGDKDTARAFYGDEEMRRTYLPNYQEYSPKQIARMTHLEYFPSMDAWLLFDYAHRDPVSGNACVLTVKNLVVQQKLD